MKKQLFIIAGANGSGKTTFAKRFTHHYRLSFVNADEIAKELNPSDTSGGELQAGRIFFKQIETLLESQASFTLESTLSGLYLKKWIDRVKKDGYTVNVIYLFLENPKVCMERIKERVLKGGHFVPDDDVIRRYFRSKSNFWNIYKNMVDSWFLIYNSDLRFTEFCIGQGSNYTINDDDLFAEFIKGIEVIHES